jgi:hypothetical protein
VFVQFMSNLIHAFGVPENPVSDAFRIEVLQHTTHDCMCREICGGQGEHQTGGNGSNCLEEVSGKLVEVNSEDSTYRVSAQCWLTSHKEL